jgi:hypothetical protein
MSDMDCSLVLYHDMLNRIKTRANFLRQVEKAPEVYAAMVVEVARRRLFSHHYLRVSGVVGFWGQKCSSPTAQSSPYPPKCTKISVELIETLPVL